MDSADDLSHALAATRLAEGTVPEGTSTVQRTTGELIGGLPPPVLALCCQFAGDSGSLVKRMACCHRAAAEARSEVWAALFTVGSRVVLHGLKTESLNLRRGTVVQTCVTEGRVGVRLDAERKPKSIRHSNLRPERALYEFGEPDEIHFTFYCDGCGARPIVGTRFRCLACMRLGPGYDLCLKCWRAGTLHPCFDSFGGQFDPSLFRIYRDSKETSLAKIFDPPASPRPSEAELARKLCQLAPPGDHGTAMAETIFQAQFPGKSFVDKAKSLGPAALMNPFQGMRLPYQR